jgi:hypothetical protein
VRSRLRDASVVLGIILLSSVLVGLHVRDFTELSPVDELQHIDSLFKASQGHVVQSGEKVGPVAMHEEACRGVDASFRPPPCNGDLRPELFQELGYNTAAVHPPVYYFATAAVASALVAVHGTHDLVTAGRLVGILWLGLGLALTWFAARRLGAGTAARSAVIVMLASAPAVIYYDSIINPDTTALFAGALVLWTSLAWEDGDLPAALPLLAAALAVSLKAFNLLAVLAVASYVLLGLLPGPVDRARVRRDIAMAVGMVAVAVAAALAWVEVKGLIAIRGAGTNPMDVQFHAGHLTLVTVFSQVPSFLSPLDRSQLAPFMLHPLVLAIIPLASLTLLAATVGSVLTSRRFERTELLAIATTALLFLGPPLLVVATFVTQHAFVMLPNRYGFSLLPLMAAITASALRNRLAVAASWLIALASVAVSGWYLVHPTLPT